MSRYQNGVWAEYYAALFLFIKGYRILAMRYKTKIGEIDIIARRGTMTIFTEVKFRKNLDVGAHSITAKSQLRIRRAAEHYMVEKRNESNTMNGMMRMDAIIVTHKFRIHHIKDAF